MFRLLGMCVVASAIGLGTSTDAKAQVGVYFGNGGFGISVNNGYNCNTGYRYSSGYNSYRSNYGYRGYSGPVYHQPSVHYDRVYHPTYGHYTPGRGYHTHGHYDYVPHYTPGHYDTQHGNHIHANPYYHH